MYDIRQFKPALYILLLLGMSGFALAAQSPSIWVLGCGGILLQAWLVRRGRYAPMPRIVANTVTLVAFGYTAHQLASAGTGAVLVIGEFLVLMQLIKLWEHRGNRDSAQLLILSLLLMVAAAINTASLVFGVMLIVYLFLSLYCCLLFHLKVESDTAKAGLAVSEDKISPSRLRQDQRYLTRSMRRLTVVVSAVAIFFAVAVFLFFPRKTGAGILGGLDFRPAQTLTGFSDRVSFQQVAKISQNNEIIAYVSVLKNDQPVKGGETLVLRGTTLDTYNTGRSLRDGKWQWTRSHLEEGIRPEEDVDRDQTAPLGPEVTGDRWRQKITLRPTGTNVLFGIAGPAAFTPRRPVKFRFSPYDGVLECVEPLTEPIDYELVSSGSLQVPPPDDPEMLLATPMIFGNPAAIDPQVADYARRPEVSGTGPAGPLAALRRARFPDPDPLDEQIASNIEQHLSSTFSYTLDLTDARSLEGRDPIVAFLYDLRRGHCEYFAGAMTLMCQSLGMQARMVVGFKSDEFNGLGGYYIVRQSDAHAWVEVNTANGWKSFDPTAGADSAAARHRSAWDKVRHFFDFMEYTYANSVIAYDNDNRDNLIQAAENGMSKVAVRSSSVFPDLRDLDYALRFWKVSSTLLGGFMLLMVLSVFGFMGVFLWEKWRLRRRAARIGIDRLPPSEQIRLARQLGFYDDLLRVLGRHQITRPPHLTPLEFCDSLQFLPSDVYETVRRLTSIFYKVRYGRVQLKAGQQKHLATVLSRIGSELTRPAPLAAGTPGMD